MTPVLGQIRPGEWFVFFDNEPLFAVPSWLIEPHMDDLDLVRRELQKIYGAGRTRGKLEGRKEVQDQIKSTLNM